MRSARHSRHLRCSTRFRRKGSPHHAQPSAEVLRRSQRRTHLGRCASAGWAPAPDGGRRPTEPNSDSSPEPGPAPPHAGHDQTIDRWRTDLEVRLADYVTAYLSSGRLLIAARSRLTVLNWGHLEEELVCSTIVGTHAGAGKGVFARRPSRTLRDLIDTSVSTQVRDGEPLILENIGHAFHQIHADWLAFRPDVTVALGWTPDSSRPGRWYSATGDPAVETLWWIDGWWGHAARLSTTRIASATQ